MTDTAELYLEYMAVDWLRTRFHPDNPKDHAIADIRRSMGRFGYTQPIALDERTELLSEGHGRIELLADDQDHDRDVPEHIRVDEHGKWWAPVTRGWRSANDDEAAAYLAASNRLVELGGWHSRPLVEVLERARTTSAGLEGIGFNDDNLKDLLVSSGIAAERASSFLDDLAAGAAAGGGMGGTIQYEEARTLTLVFPDIGSRAKAHGALKERALQMGHNATMAAALLDLLS